MITLVEALNYRCLRYVKRPLKPFHVLVGPNASGKTTFMDVIGFLRDLVSGGLEWALSERTPTPGELLFRGQGDRFELAVEARIPRDLRELTMKPELDTVRYQVAIGFDETQRQCEFKAETLLLQKTAPVESMQSDSFPKPPPGPESLLTNIRRQGNKVVINKVPGGNDNFYNESKPPNLGWAPSFKLGPGRSALGNLLADADSFPVATWFRDYLAAGVQKFVLNSLTIKRPSPPTRVSGFLPDGSNLPWVVARLRREEPERYRGWIEHLRTALPDLVDIATFERPEDKHCYMIHEYAGGVKVPSWLVSDGTLRLTALTLPAKADLFSRPYPMNSRSYIDRGSLRPKSSSIEEKAPASRSYAARRPSRTSENKFVLGGNGFPWQAAASFVYHARAASLQTDAWEQACA